MTGDVSDSAPVPGRGSRHRVQWERLDWGGSTYDPGVFCGNWHSSVVTLRVYGTPKPKGSMRHVGHGRLVEQIDNADWRADVKGEALRLLTGNGLPLPLFPDGPVEVTVFLFVPKPKSAPKRRRTWPVTRASGDVDKHARLILDALTDAGMIHDDSQVVHLSVHKDYADPADGPGAIIHVAPWGG